ncbi:MAG: N-acetyl-gamma-glutamyl-phosphate reductase [Acidimicrobiia bacterium]
MGYTIGIAGASGYAGGELVRLVDAHPALDLGYLAAHSRVGDPLGLVHPQLSGGERVMAPLDPDAMSHLDLVFLALPHGASADPAMALLDRGVRVVDLGSDFRLDTPERYCEAYGSDHPFPDQLGAWPFGVPELFGGDLAGADRVAVPGCYPTSVALALAPLLASGVVEPAGIVVSSMSGVSGAGRSVRADLLFGAVAESVTAYGVLTHRHRPEMERALEAACGENVEVTFTPHLVPMQRGLLSTCHAKSTGAGDAAAVLQAAYAGSPFVRVVPEPPHTSWVVGSNRCFLSAHADDRTGSVIVVSAIDNLLKGAAGQAVQCANVMLGLPGAEGLPTEGWMP